MVSHIGFQKRCIIAIALSSLALAERAIAAPLTLGSEHPDVETQWVASATATASINPPSPLLLSQQFNTEFPLPNSVRNFQNVQGPGEAAINFQTDLNLSQAIAFYRQQFGRLGLTERSVNTAITDGTFSLIFDTWSNGKPVVVQGVSMGRSTNISLRLDNL